MVIGSFCHIPNVTSVEPVLWALRDGLLLPKDHNIENLEIEVDTTSMLHFMKAPSHSNLLLSHLIVKCRMPVHSMSSSSMMHIFQGREQMCRCVDPFEK